LSRIVLLFVFLALAWLNPCSAQSIPALSFEIKKPQKLENKKLGSERGADKKFTFPRRVVQNTFTKYNWHFNANEKLKEIIARAKDAHRDDYTQLLSFYNYSPQQTISDSLELDSVIYKANAGILLHDLRNDWVDNMYMLMGKAYYFRQVYDTAYLTFQYINYAFSPKEKDGYDKTIGSNSNEGGNAFSISTKESSNIAKKITQGPPSRNESFLWLIRTYLAVDEYPEAAGMIETLKNDPLFPARLKPELHEMQALWFYQQEMYDSSAAHLEQALEIAANKEERARWEYLIAQMYEASGKNERAQEFYLNSVKHTLNPVLEVYGRLNSIRQNRGDDKAVQENIDELLKMARKDRYSSYRDIIYYSAALMELERNNRDGAKALLLRSTKALIDRPADPNQKSRSFLLLGDLSYNESNYSDAKRFYDSVQNTEIVKDPEQFNNRKTVLARIADDADIIYRQDSVQRIAAMPEAEREAFIKKLVRRLRKEQGLKEEEPVAANNNPLNANTAPVDLFDNSAKGEWYFYNPSLKGKGYTEFKGKWGNRPNVDNWRRAAAVSQAVQKQQQQSDADNARKLKQAEAASGEISYDALLKRLPLTEKQLSESNDSIEVAQLDLGKALMEGLEDYPAAIEELEEFCDRFKYSGRRAEALMYLYYCYQKTGNTSKAAAVKSELQQRYAGTEQEQAITNPKAVAKGNDANAEVTKKYDQIYTLFIEGKFDEALAQKRAADSLYANNYWTPQLLYIQSIYFIRQRNDDSAKASLQNIVNLYPNSILATKAQNMIEVLNRRKEIEDYLTKLEIKRPVDSATSNDITITTPPPQRPPVTPNVKTDSTGARVSPPVAEKPKTVPPRDTVQTKPAVPLKVAFARNAAAPHYVAIITNKVDGVFVTETKNAFNRYNKQYFYNKTIDITSEIINDSVRIVLMSNFENAEAAMAYLEKVRKIAATEIVPWLPVAKYSFAVITAPNLELLKNSQDFAEYRKFLQQAFPGKFDQ
jgi:outer membrane protein assembly factor BamD (BamD/ComL family)